MSEDSKDILLVEDDENLGQILSEYLQLKGYGCVLCRNGEEGISQFREYAFDLCILDVMMPKKDGFALAKEIHDLSPETPFLFLTAKSMKEDAIKGLSIGAEDYITKPFSMEELLLRLNVIFRRFNGVKKTEQTAFTISKLVLDSQTRELSINGKSRTLTTKENELLKLLCNDLGNTVLRKEALTHIWGDDSYFNARSMDVYIAKLRKYLKEDEELQIITIHGEGFKLVRI
ncbi:MAG: response regulator transcription factor [Bacteroidota bacterium]